VLGVDKRIRDDRHAAYWLQAAARSELADSGSVDHMSQNLTHRTH